MTPKEKFEQACKDFLVELISIDQETPWRETEPQWWLNMQDIQKYVISKMQADASHTPDQ